MSEQTIRNPVEWAVDELREWRGASRMRASPCSNIDAPVFPAAAVSKIELSDLKECWSRLDISWPTGPTSSS